MTVIVTGDSKGLGRTIVEKLLKETNCNVIGISRSENEAVEEFERLFGSRFQHITYDFSDVHGIKTLYQQKIRNLGPITGLVNNSAIAYDDIVTNINVDRLIELYNINVLAAMNLTKYVIRDMLLHKTRGSIVFISSVSAHTSYKGLSMYASTKGALEAFSKGVAREWGELGIRSNCVIPGFMETSMSSTLTEEQKSRIYKRTSLKQATSIDSVADTALFLLSNKSISITGTNIHVDNGTI